MSVRQDSTPREETHGVEVSRILPDAEWFRMLAESSSAAVMIYLDNRILFANGSIEEVIGYTPDELVAMDDPWQLVAQPFRREAAQRTRARLRGEEVPRSFKLKLRHRNGEDRWVEVSAHRILYDDQPATLATILDVTAHRRAEAAVSREKGAQVTLTATGDGVVRTDARGLVDYMNPVAERLTGWSFDEARDRPVTEVYRGVSEASQRPRRNPVVRCLEEGRTIVPPGHFSLRGRDGGEHVVQDSAAPIQDAHGSVLGAVLMIRDLTHVRGLEQQMVYLTSHDPLTGLLNRQEFEIHLEAALESARDRDIEHCLLYLDVMELKLINDCYGLVAGDELLRQTADLLRQELSPKGVLGRVAGDDFGLLLRGTGEAEARSVARHLLHELHSFRFAWAGQQFEIGLSVGLVPVTGRAVSVQQLIKAADAACYLARQSGRNQLHAYSDDDDAMAERHGRLHWVQRIHRALAEDRFRLYHQEIRPLSADLPPIYEILLRMVDDDGSHLLPGSFIPVAESHDLAPSLDRWVVRRTLKLLTAARRGPLVDSAVSVNLSAQSLGDETFVDDLAAAITSSGVDPERLYFEITETAAVANLSRSLRLIKGLKSLGCHFVLDDFGTGFSSFAYLKNLPVDVLKIDGEFVSSLTDEPIHQAMVAAVNGVGHVMGLRTIAEWVEDAATLERVRDLGVDYAQGFHLHRPEEIDI